MVVKWFNPEKYSDIADLMKNKHIKGVIRLVSLTLMVFEVANALRYNPDQEFYLKLIVSDHLV